MFYNKSVTIETERNFCGSAKKARLSAFRIDAARTTLVTM
jgi:hypothetical protein